LRFLHPITMLGFGMPALPADLSLEAGDTLTLFRAMSQTRNDIPVDLDPVDPINFFSRSQFLRQKDILDYESKLKEILAELISSPDSTEATSPLQQVVHSLHDPVLAKIPDNLNNPPSPKRFLRELPQLLADLHCENNLVSQYFSLHPIILSPYSSLLYCSLLIGTIARLWRRRFFRPWKLPR
jgi:hypothetical protein